MMTSFYAASYFLIDLMGGGVLIAEHATRSLLKPFLERPIQAVAPFTMPRGDSIMAAGGEISSGGYLRPSTAQLPLVVLQMGWWAFAFLGGQ